MFTSHLVVMAMALSTTAVSAFAPSRPFGFSRNNNNVALDAITEPADASLTADLKLKSNYKPGGADTEFARRYRHLAGAKVKTVGEAFAEFTAELGFAVNALYKNMVTDLVGTTHLVVVNARFQRDPIWSLGMISTVELLLRNYPEKDVSAKIISALFKSVGLNEAQVRAEAASVLEWAKGKTRTDVEAAMRGENDGPVAAVARTIKENEFWMYSRYFGLGLLKIMEAVGIDMDKDEVYPIMEDWMSNKLGRSPLTACADSDLFFKVRDKLDMMETMMKEIEIREKKRLAERLEQKAEEALRMAEKEAKMQAEIEAEAAKQRERVA